MVFPPKGFGDNPNVSWVKVGKTTSTLQTRPSQYHKYSSVFFCKKSPAHILAGAIGGVLIGYVKYGR